MNNPTLEQVEKGDKFIGGNLDTLLAGFAYESVVLDAEDIRRRFGKDDRIVTVRIRSVDLDGNERHVVDHKKQIWWSDLSKGLV